VVTEALVHHRWLVLVFVVAACGPSSTLMIGGQDGGAPRAGGRAGGASGGTSAGGASGGSSAGGSTSGGFTAGGSTAGGSAAGGSTSGGSTAGGSTAGGSTAGGSTAGGSTAGGSTAGGSTAGGSTAGGPTAGGSTAGGSTAGGSTAGGSTAGGSTAGGSTAGGSTAGGSTSGGSTAGGSTSASPCFAVADAGVAGGALLPDGGFTPSDPPITGLTATATSEYGSAFTASNVLDFNLNTSWYVDYECVALSTAFCCAPHNITLSSSTSRAISAVVIRGNRDFATYDVFTGILEFLDPAGAVVASRMVVANQPQGDWATTFTPAVANVSTVRFSPGWAQDPSSGISELQLYGP
jgi:hypothetical protein